jgi:hypothetical protein
MYGGRVFRTPLLARWAVFFDTLDLAWESGPAGIDLASGGCYTADFYLPRWDTYLAVWSSFPDEFITPDGIAIVANRDGVTPLGKFILAGQQLQEVKGNIVRPRLYMVCGSPGVPCLRNWRGRWKLDGGCAILHVAQVAGRLLMPVEAWSDSSMGVLDIWPYYLDGEADGECWRQSAVYPSGTMASYYVGGGRSYATPRLTRAFREAKRHGA